MKKYIVALAVVLALLAQTANAELQTQTISANAGSQTVSIGYGTLTIVNDGSSAIFVRVFWEGETAAAATTSSPQIKSGEGFTFYKSMGISAVSIVTAASGSATVRLIYW
jgi:hypothetical protein